MAAVHQSLTALRNFSIDRQSPVPLYFQVSEHLERAITSGDLPPGTLLLNEVDLAEALNLSRPTMRRAIQTLVDKGLVVRRRGIGTRVVQPKMLRPLELTSLHDDLARSGQEPSTTVLSFEPMAADAAIAEKLGVAEGDEVYELIRLRSANGRPISLMTNYLPSAVVSFGADDLRQRGLYALIRARGTTLHSAHQVIGARTATAAEAKKLDEPRGAALLTMERVTFDDHGLAVEYGTHVYASSRYSFEVSLLTG